MKVKKGKDGFQPFALEITIETAEEARALYAIFNHARTESLIHPMSMWELRKAIGSEHQVCDGIAPDAEIANGITAREFYGG